MSENKFEKLDKFLAENRPEPPAAPPTEYQGILRRIRRPQRTPFRLFRSPILASLGSVAALYVAWLVIGTPKPVAPVEEAFDAESFIVSSVEGYYEAAEEE